MSNQVTIISGGDHKDERGKLSFFNAFDMSQVRRMYFIEPELGTVRAWQGHVKESKWLIVVEGECLIQAVPLDESQSEFSRFSTKLSSTDLKIVNIPGGYYNGFEALKANSKIWIFSDATTEQSKEDDYRLTINELSWNDIAQNR